jgi:hypothetical protein
MPKQQKTKVPKRISFQYIKSNFFRVIHADGFHGGLSSNLDIHMAVYSERKPIPQEVVHVLTDEGVLGEEDLNARKARSGLLREVDADIVVDLNTARSVVRWLQERIDEADRILDLKRIKATTVKTLARKS